jgi:hypothetical protein
MGWEKEDSMKVEHEGGRGLRSSLLRAVPVLTLLLTMILAIAMARGSVIIPQQSTVALTGIVSDSVCGGDHGIKAAGDPECTRSCVELGAQYALMVGKLRVGKRMYILQGHEADLDRFAGKEVTVKGRAFGRDRIIVDQVDRSYEAAKE